MSWKYWAAFGAFWCLLNLVFRHSLIFVKWGVCALIIALLVYANVFYGGVKGLYPEVMLWVACAVVIWVVHERRYR